MSDDQHFAGKGLIPAWQRTETYKDGLRLVDEVNAKKGERKELQMRLLRERGVKKLSRMLNAVFEASWGTSDCRISAG